MTSTLARLSIYSVLAATLALTISVGAPATAKPGRGHGQESAIGEPGNASQASRTITMKMTDNRFTPGKVSVRKGETIRFKVKNSGNFVHEFNIGTAAMHIDHQKEMMMMFDHGALEVDKIHRGKMAMAMPNGATMQHDDPNSVLLEPGETAEVIWEFSTDAELEFACNLPGHYESGMMGHIRVN